MRMKCRNAIAASLAVAAMARCSTYTNPPARRAVYTVAAKPADRQSARLAGGVVFDIRGGLLSGGRELLADGARPAADERVVAVDMAIQNREIARLGDFRKCEGTARVRVADDGKEVAAREFKAEGGRADDETEALRGVRESLSGQIKKWVADLPIPETKTATRK